MTLGSATRRRLVDQALIDLLSSKVLLGPSLDLIADCLAGHPHARRYDGASNGNGARLWCFVHQCDHRRCEHDGLACGGTPVTGVDPTGDAATSLDSAAAARAVIDDAVTALADAAQTLAVTLTAWSPPTDDMQRPDPAAVSAPDGWCTSCWRDSRYHEPVSAHYAGLCQWCGRFKAAQGYLPPVELLRKRHSSNPKITEADIARYRPTGRR